MANLASKLVSKLMIVIVVIMVLVAFKESVLTDDALSAVFGQMMGALPFAGLISDMICKIMKYNQEIPIITTGSVLTDLLKLAVMACIQPLVTGLLSMIFLRLPAKTAGNYEAQEKYMNQLPYKCKEALLTVVSAPIIALAAANLTTGISTFISQNFSPVASFLVGLLTVIGVGSVSLIPLLAGGVALGVAITWRLLVTLLSKMASTFMTNALCLWIYVALLGAVQWQIITSILSLIIWLIVMDFGVKCLQKAIVS